jgi:uncharacterized protein YbdZ (MbtH family)
MVGHALAFFGLMFLRLPPREVQRQPISQLHREMLEGLRWVWQQRLVRVTTLCAVVLNFFFSAFYIIIIVLARHRGIPTGEIGVMAAMLGAGGLVGALLAPSLTQKLSPFLSIASVFWILTLLTPVAVFIHNGYLLGALLFAMALLPPTANTTITARQLLIAPDDMRGRLSGALGLMVGGAAAVGPMLGGVLIGLVPGSEAVLICAAGMAAITAVVTVSPTLHRFPQIESTEDGEALVTAPEPESPPNQFPTEGEGEMDDDARYEVLRNDEDQYSLWPAGHEIPAGWYRVGKEGSKEECSAYVDEVWTDMRPRSLRERMDAEAQP